MAYRAGPGWRGSAEGSTGTGGADGSAARAAAPAGGSPPAAGAAAADPAGARRSEPILRCALPYSNAVTAARSSIRCAAATTVAPASTCGSV